METRPAKAVRVDPKGGRVLSFARWMRRDTPLVFRSLDREVEISITKMPASVDVENVTRLVVFVADSERVAGGLAPSEVIDEPTRRVFAEVGEEYGELCDRLFADDPVFSYGTAEDCWTHGPAPRTLLL